MGEAVRIEVRWAMSGELLVCLNLRDTDTMVHLHREVQKAAGAPGAHFSLLRGQEVLPQDKTLGALDLGPSSTLTAVRVQARQPNPVSLGRVDVSKEGYHCHDTRLTYVPCSIPGRCYLSWTRGFYGDSYDEHRREVHSRACHADGVYHQEIVVTDVLEAVGGVDAIFNGTSTSSRRRTERLRILPGIRCRENFSLKVLAVLEEERLLLTEKEEDPEGRYSERGTARLLLRGPEQGPVEAPQAVWVQAEEPALREAFNHTVEIQGVCLVEGGFLATAEAKTVGGAEDGAAGGETVFLLMEFRYTLGQRAELLRWVVQKSNTFEKMDASYDPGLLASSDGSTIWLRGREKGQKAHRGLFVASRESLLLRPLVLSSTLKPGPGQPQWRARQHCSTFPDTVTDAFVSFSDFSCEVHLTGESPCFIYRLPASEVGKEGNLTFLCQADFVIDGFSDSFCIAELAYEPITDSLLIFDAGDSLWALRMADVRGWEGNHT